MKNSSFSHLRAALIGVAWCLFISPLPSAVNAADPKLGSPEEPLAYEGPGLIDPQAPDGHLMFSPGVQNVQICRANRKPSQFSGGNPGYTYQHHMDLGCWKGRLYAVWDMTVKDEDTPPCRLVYSTSTDGFNWTEPKDLYPPNKGWNLRFYFYHASNGRMLAFAAASYPTKAITEKKKATVLVREITADHQLGEIWTLMKPGPSYPPSFEECKDAGFVAACREACNNRLLLEQQDYGMLLGDRRMKWHDPANWPGGKVGGMDKFWTFGKALCFFHRQDGTLVSLCKLGFVSLSTDEGQNWSFPVVPKGLVAGSGKIWGQRTPDGRYALVYPPQNPGPRFPMVVTTSDDGISFHDMRVIHGEVPPERYQGKWKDLGPQYLRGVAEWAGDAPTIDKSAIWVIYSLNKEDIWVSRVPTPIAAETKEAVHDTFDGLPTGLRVPDWHTYAPSWASVRIAKDPASSNQYLELADREPADYARAIRTFPPSTAADVSFRLAAGQVDHGRLEIELLGERGARPVQIVLNDQGKLQASVGGQMKEIGTYRSDQWTKFTLQVKDGKFTLLREGKAVVKNAAFAEPAAMVYALSFRTGEFRGTVSDKAETDLPNTEEPTAAAVYRIDDVSTTGLQRYP
jgi:hypothetical protein